MTRTVKEIFYSGFDGSVDWMILNEIILCIQNGIFRYQEDPIASHDDYTSTISKILGIDGPGPQGKGHMALKELSQQWLNKLEKESLTEVHFAGLHPDVLSGDETAVIECGTTDANCLFFYFDQPSVQSVSILPYPYELNENLILYTFYASDQYISYRKEWKNRLRQLVQKVRP